MNFLQTVQFTSSKNFLKAKTDQLILRYKNYSLSTNTFSFLCFLILSCLYKGLLILYVVIFSLYVLFTRVPDYFNGEYIKGVVAKASFSAQTNSPLLVVDYNVGSEKLQYKTDMWFLKNYKPKQFVTIIYNPANPSVSCIYAFIGYWIKWPELILTAAFFIILFIAAKTITGNNSTKPLRDEEIEKKRR